MIDPSPCFTNTKEIQMSKLKSLQEEAKIVGRHGAELDAALTNVAAARAEMMTAIVEAVRPALRALSSRVALSSHESPAGILSEPAAWRGIYLDGDGPKLTRNAPVMGGYVRGRWGGNRLMLRDDGALVVLTYDGAWTNVPGELSSWTAQAIEIDAGTAAAKYDVTAILDRLMEATMAQAKGASPRRAAEARGEAERWRQAAQIIRSSR